MSEYILLGIASILTFGMIAQWLAWYLRLPSILLLLIFGFIAGPITGLLKPDELMGEALFPLVSSAVALILFEGGLSLKISELRSTGHVVRNLISIGVLLTWVMCVGAALWILGLPLSLALLFGAILVVTGPTVIIPLLRHIRATSQISSIIKWEGIVNDPIGAVLAVLVFEAILVTGFQSTAISVVSGLITTLLIGLVGGGVGAILLIFLLKRYWIPDYLQNGIILMTVLVTFVGSNLVQAESGLLTVTLMGVLLANQKWISIKHIIEFKENLRVLLIASLFIILAARLQVDDLQYISWNSLFFLLTLIFVIRPISIFLSTIKSGLSWKEKLFLSWMAPRGIVAAAVTSVFALELVEHGYPEAARLVPEMFVVIVGTVAIYGLSAAAVGRWLGVAQPDPQGVLIAGAHPWAREIGLAVQEAGYKVMLVDTNWANLNAARLEGLPTFYASILSEYVMDKIELGSLGRLLALTPNDEVNSLAVLHFTEVFERAEVYQLPPKETNHNRKETISQPLRGRLLFAPHATYAHLTERFKHTEIKKTGLTEKFTYEMFKDRYGERALPLFLIKANGNLIIFTASNEVFPKGGDTLISLIDPIEEPEDELVERFAGNPVYVKFK